MWKTQVQYLLYQNYYSITLVANIIFIL